MSNLSHPRKLWKFVFLLLSLPHSVFASEKPLVFIHATVIDATRAAPQSNVTVIITGNRITSLRPNADAPPPENAQIIDATGKYLIPGLWDMHVHWEDKNYLPLFIANGVTGIRIMWGFPVHHQMRNQIEKGTLLGPRMLIASTIVDGPNPVWPGSDSATNAADGRQAVLDAKLDGADFVKVYDKLPREAYFAIAEESKKQGIPFAGHVPRAISPQEASQAGQKSIEHLTGLLAACSDPAKTAALFAEFKTNHTWQCPTLTVLRGYMTSGSAKRHDDLLKYMPAGLMRYWANSDQLGIIATITRFLTGSHRFQKYLDLVAGLQRAGVEILAGTDTENLYCFPGFSLHDELSLLVDAGLTPMQALQAATINPARFLNREKDLGTIEPGKLADIVMLDANPLENINNTRKIAAVILDGKLYPKTDLDNMLSQVESHAKKSEELESKLRETMQTGGAEAAVQKYRQLRSARPDAYDWDEDQLNNFGDDLLESGNPRDAIPVLKLNAELYPQSSPACDILGDAALAAGDTNLAIQTFAKSLKLYPQNHQTLEKLNQLEHLKK
ncbi:MAG TPA: amidohydrolase family protein [Verrucomicrobiae bacterium]